MSLDFWNAKICSPSSLSKGCIEPGRYHEGKYFPLFFNREKLPFFWNESAPFSGLKVLFFLDRLNYQWQDSKKKSVIFLNCDDQWWQKRGAFPPTKLKVWGQLAPTIGGDVTLAVVDSIKERCLQWIGRERKLTLILTLILTLTLITNPKH